MCINEPNCRAAGDGAGSAEPLYLLCLNGPPASAGGVAGIEADAGGRTRSTTRCSVSNRLALPDRSVAVPALLCCQFRFHRGGQLQQDAPASHDIRLRFVRGNLLYELLPYAQMPCRCALRLIETFVVVVVVVPMAGPQRKSWPGRDSWWTLRRRTASRRCIWPPSTTTATWPRSSSKRWGEIL